MQTVPPFLAFFIVFSIVAAAAATFRYWILEPEKAQGMAVRLFWAVRRPIATAYFVARWPITLIVGWAYAVLFFSGYLFVALAWVLLKKVAGEPARFTIKFD